MKVAIRQKRIIHRVHSYILSDKVDILGLICVFKRNLKRNIFNKLGFNRLK